MEQRGLWSLLLVAFLYVCFGITSASGKCSGRWAIHACGGGNGKRSEGSMVPSQLDSRSGYERFRHMIPSETSDESNKIEDIEPDTTYNQKSLIELLRPLLRNTEARIKANNFMRKIILASLKRGQLGGDES